jgi:glucan phosphoethanolaminetransferase (alkaline phosphatase superfamily)
MSSEVKYLIKDIVTIVIAVVCVVGNVVLFWKLFFRKHPKIIMYLIIVGTAVVDVVKMIGMLQTDINNHRNTHNSNIVLYGSCMGDSLI